MRFIALLVALAIGSPVLAQEITISGPQGSAPGSVTSVNTMTGDVVVPPYTDDMARSAVGSEFSGATCNGCAMANPTFTGTMTLNGDAVLTETTVYDTLGPVVTNVNGQSGPTIILDLSPYRTAAQVNASISAAVAAIPPSPVLVVNGYTGTINLACHDLIDDVASCATDTTNAANITAGTLSAARGGAGSSSGILKANGSGVVSAAVSGTDYAPPTGITGALKGNGSGGFAAAACSDLSNAAASCSTDATNAANISAGVLGSSRGGAGSVSGLLKANGSGVVSAAVAGTDYVAVSGMSAYAPLASPGLTGTPTAPTASAGNNSTQIATTAYVDATKPLTGTTGSIGGGLLLVGGCTSGTATITGATVGMVAVSSPTTYPGDGVQWQTYVSATNTVTVKVCGIVAITPVATSYNVRVIR